MKEAEAQQIAVTVLHFIASDPDNLGRFLAATGLGPDNLRQAARDPNFLNAVLTFISDDEKMLLACADWTTTKPERIMQAYECLVGNVTSDFD